MKILNLSRLFILTAVALFLTGGTLAAQFVYIQPFNSPVGGIPEDWSLARSGSPIIEVSEYQESDDYRLRISRDTGGFGGVMYTGTQGEIVDGIIQDFEVSTLVVFNSTNDGRGITARAQSSTFAFNGYWAYTGAGENNTHKLAISKNPTASGTNRGEELASVILSERLTTSREYLYTFSGIGNLLVAEVFKSDSEGEFTILLGKVSVNDDSYTEGKMGYMARHGGNGRSDYIRNYELTSIPEPLTVSLLAGVAGFVLIRRFRKTG